MSIQASLEISISAQSINLFNAIENYAIYNDLKYKISPRHMISCAANTSSGTSSGLISKNIKFVTTVSAIAGFLIQIQPTIQEVIKADSLEGITISCGDKKIEIQGENDIVKAITAMKELECN
ncbi:MAG: hypothetical protein AAGE84_13590 [Cyanobacteria bacterium P01_G01_bin.39]